MRACNGCLGPLLQFWWRVADSEILDVVASSSYMLNRESMHKLNEPGSRIHGTIQFPLGDYCGGRR